MRNDSGLSTQNINYLMGNQESVNSVSRTRPKLKLAKEDLSDYDLLSKIQKHLKFKQKQFQFIKDTGRVMELIRLLQIMFSNSEIMVKRQVLKEYMQFSLQVNKQLLEQGYNKRVPGDLIKKLSMRVQNFEHYPSTIQKAKENEKFYKVNSFTFKNYKKCLKIKGSKQNEYFEEFSKNQVNKVLQYNWSQEVQERENIARIMAQGIEKLVSNEQVNKKTKCENKEASSPSSSPSSDRQFIRQIVKTNKIKLKNDNQFLIFVLKADNQRRKLNYLLISQQDRKWIEQPFILKYQEQKHRKKIFLFRKYALQKLKQISSSHPKYLTPIKKQDRIVLHGSKCECSHCVILIEKSQKDSMLLSQFLIKLFEQKPDNESRKQQLC